jgi:hypothetical protein
LNRQVRRVKAPKRWEGLRVELIDGDRFAEVLQAMTTEVTHPLRRADEVARRLGQEYLPSVSGVGDSGGAMHVDPGVFAFDDERLAGV